MKGQRRHDMNATGACAQSGTRAPKRQCAACRVTAAGVARRGSLAETTKWKSSGSPTGGEPSQGTCGNLGAGTEAVDLRENNWDSRGVHLDLGKQGAAGGEVDAAGTIPGPSQSSVQKGGCAWRESDGDIAEGATGPRACTAGGGAGVHGLGHLERQGPSPVVPNTQTNSNLGGKLETLTGIIEHMWNLDAGPPLENHVSAIHASRSLLHASSDIIAQEDDLALAATQVEELPDFEVDEEEHLADFEEMHAPGAPRLARKTTGSRPARTPRPKKSRTS